MNDIDALLRDFDAEPSAQLTPAETARSERLLTQITQCAQAAPARHTAARSAAVRRPARARRTLTSAGIAAALAFGVVAASQVFGHAAGPRTGQALAGSGLTSAELADWTATPTHPALTSPVVQRAVRSCIASFSGQSLAAFTRISDVDQRGSVITLMATDPASGITFWCMNASGHPVTSYVMNASYLPPLPTIGTTAVNALFYGWGVGPGTISEAFGQAGRDVTGISFKTTAGETITATVQDGFWSVWWPPNASNDHDFGGTVTWTIAGGATHTVPLAGLPTLRR